MSFTKIERCVHDLIEDNFASLLECSETRLTLAVLGLAADAAERSAINAAFRAQLAEEGLARAKNAVAFIADEYPAETRLDLLRMAHLAAQCAVEEILHEIYDRVSREQDFAFVDGYFACLRGLDLSVLPDVLQSLYSYRLVGKGDSTPVYLSLHYPHGYPEIFHLRRGSKTLYHAVEMPDICRQRRYLMAATQHPDFRELANALYARHHHDVATLLAGAVFAEDAPCTREPGKFRSSYCFSISDTVGNTYRGEYKPGKWCHLNGVNGKSLVCNRFEDKDWGRVRLAIKARLAAAFA